MNRVSDSGLVQACMTHGPDETRAMAGRLARALGPGAVVALHGDLGAGKTCFVRGMAEALDVGPVRSPSFALIHEYLGPRPLYHIDLYRIADPEEVLELGLDEYWESEGITVIEWAERAASLLPRGTVHVQIEFGEGADDRRIRVRQEDAPC
jgi:tRNA threonylcarbamoyladenosine biosynthesis protein TsaE